MVIAFIKKLVYNIAYNRAYNKAYDKAYHEAYHEAYERGFEKRGYKHEIWNIYGGSCADFGLLDESKKAASQIASQIATQEAQTTANRTLDAGAFTTIAGLISLLANKKSK